MYVNSSVTTHKYSWQEVKPIMRYVIGSCFIVAASSLLDYSLSYLTAVLGLGYIAPGVPPLTLKQGFSFVLSLAIITGLAYVFSALLIDIPLVFIPLLGLAIFWLYYTDKLNGMIKIFAILSILLIPLVSLNGVALGGFVAISLVFNALMAVCFTQFIFFIFPWSSQDIEYQKEKGTLPKQSENQRFAYALKILAILFPVVLLFYFFNFSSSSLVLIFIAILATSPALANAKIGAVFIVANIVGGLMAILAYQLLTIVPMFLFMLFLVVLCGLIFGKRLFSKSKVAAIFGSAYSTFLLILGNVTSSDSEAGETLWARIVQISIAVIYVVVAFKYLKALSDYKSTAHE